MTRAELEQKLASNPQFKLVGGGDVAVVIPGAKIGSEAPPQNEDRQIGDLRDDVSAVMIPPDPVSRLQAARAEVDRVFGEGFAREHSDLVGALVLSVALDNAAAVIAAALLVDSDDVVPLRRVLVGG
jgi:hypothetical protein